MSTTNPNPEKIVVVSGDMTLDWNFARAKGSQHGLLSWDVDASFDLHMQSGGSALIAELLGKVGERLSTSSWGRNKWRIVHADAAKDTLHQNDSRFHHSYAVWSLFKHDEKTPPEKPDCYVWRVNNFLGLKRAAGKEV
jgi:arginase family enzyme